VQLQLNAFRCNGLRAERSSSNIPVWFIAIGVLVGPRGELKRGAAEERRPKGNRLGSPLRCGSPSLSHCFSAGCVVRAAPVLLGCQANGAARVWTEPMGCRSARSAMKAEACDRGRRIGEIPREPPFRERREVSGHSGIVHRPRADHGETATPRCKFMNSWGSKAL